MKKIYIALIFFLAAVRVCGSEAVELVKNGRSSCVIVISDDPSPQLKEAALELQKFLYLISGAKIAVVTPDKLPAGAVRICVGENALTRQANYKLPGFRRSGYDILIKKDLIVLNGPVFPGRGGKSILSHTGISRQNLRQALSKVSSEETYADIGPMHAVSAFLEHLGVRFYAPGEEGTYVPRKKDILLKEERITKEAAFAVREYTFAAGQKMDRKLKRHLKFLKSGSSQAPAGVFALGPILREGGKKNPSWLALKGEGSPYEALEQGGYPRYSDHSFREKCWKELEKFIAARPFLREVLILPPAAADDHIHFPDQGKNTLQQDPAAYRRDVPAEFYIFLARKTARRFPGVRLLYRNSRNLLPSPGVLKKFPASLAGVPESLGVTAYAFPRAGEYWLNGAEKFVRGTSKEKCVLREFWNEYDVPELPRRGFFLAETLRKIRQKQQGFVKGFLFDLPFDPGTGSIAVPEQMYFLLYVNSKLLWEPDTDVKLLLKEYARLFFGAAAEEMEQFFIEAEKGLCRTYLRGLSPFYASQLKRDADTLNSLLERAAKKTPPGSIYRKRIEKLASSFRWMKKDIFACWKKKNTHQTAVIMPQDTPLDGDLGKYKKWYTLSSDDKTAPRTEAAFALNESRRDLFAAFRCYEPQMKKLKAAGRFHDASEIKDEDHIAVRINTPAGGEYAFLVNSAGVILDSCTSPNVLQYTGNALDWNSVRNRAKVRRYPDRWEVELSMVRCGRPPVPGSRYPWKVQLERRRFISGKKQNWFLAESGASHKRCDFYFPLVDSAGRKVDPRYNSVKIPLPGIPNGLKYLIQRKKTPSVGFSAADWKGNDWKHIKEGRLGNSIFFLGRASRYVPDARFKLQYDERALYVFYKVREKGVRAVHHTDQEMVCHDSCMEFFIRPGGSKGKYYLNFEMNCIGTLLLAQVEVLPRNRIKMTYLPLNELKKIKRHTSLKKFSGEIREEITWYAGLEIPWEVLTRYTSIPAPGQGTVWRGNIYKCADWSRFPHWLAWKETGSFHTPADFGEFTFE